MSKEEDNSNVKVPITLENIKLQVAVEQSIILPTDTLAKANPDNPTPNTSELQAATKQCASLPQNRIVVRESVERKTEQG